MYNKRKKLAIEMTSTNTFYNKFPNIQTNVSRDYLAALIEKEIISSVKTNRLA